MKDKENTIKKRQLSVSGKIFWVILLFTVVLLAFNWAIEFLFLDTFYEATEKITIRKNVDLIANNIDSQTDVPALVNRIAHTEDICIIVAETTSFNKIVDEHLWTGCEVHTRAINEYYDLARLEAGMDYSEETEGRFPDSNYSPSDYSGNVPTQDATPRSSYTYAKIVKDSSNVQYIIIAEGAITPVPTARRTLAYQLATASFAFLIISFFATAMLSKTIASPIIALNEAAKDIPKGDVDFDLVKSGYLEIEELKETLNYASLELNKLEGYRRELVANVSHDLRTPLALIKGYSEMMKDIPSEANPENLQVVIDEASRLAGLVNDMLDLSGLQDGGTKLRLKAFDLVKVLDEMLIRHGKLLMAQGFTLEWIHEDKAFVYADEMKIVQVIYNLINNAVNYSGEDRKVVVKQITNGINIRIEVTDNGEGVDVDILPHIWDRYYKSDKSHKRAVVGTGLGLSIVKSVMNMHPGGVYGVITSKGQGSTFYIELPKLDPETMDFENDFPESIEG
ncbi:MAG: Alkaline phosphatase synthesis sensor protein PhoR [Firmicutes bacterium ADurb.Bin080]|nr:HAMP domain-containing histidine kinase [Clostridiales bacterium]OQC14758.1 MAG: Alkaline phosphatase synthesis sensor protein PhoR [Firmicutes bacterium ADurb.Bin080]